MVESLYQKYLSLTGEPAAAATLVLAEVMSASPPSVLSVDEAAKKLGVGVKKVYELCQAGTLRSQKVGRHIRIQEEDIRAFLANKPAAPAAPSPIRAGRLMRL
jgi:excisionase family DNA binding protein